MASGPAGAGLLDQVALAKIHACDTNQVLGVAFLYERDSDEGVKEVDVAIRIREQNEVLSEGRHAVHIHEVGDCAQTCAAAGGHFDPARTATRARTAITRSTGRSHQYPDCRRWPQVLALDNLPRDALARPAQRLR